MTQNNLVPNGDFGTGDFSLWIPRNYDTPMSVVHHNGNYVARLVGGRNQGQNLATEPFPVQSGAFALKFNVQAPEAVPLQDTKDRRFHITDSGKTSNPLVHAFIVYTLWATNRSTGEAEIWSGSEYVDQKTRTITLNGMIRPGFEWLDIFFAIPSDPFGNKGPYFIDNVWLSVV